MFELSIFQASQGSTFSRVGKCKMSLGLGLNTSESYKVLNVSPCSTLQV